MNYYNEIDKYCAHWLYNLIQAKLIPPGDIDTRDIRDVKPRELTKYTQCHFFAGIGGWPRALALASVPPDRPLWTGSCPCQPFSAAGKRLGFTDERHLWPHWFHLISVCKPPTIFGEQVASKDGLEWFDTVQTDLENQDYAVGSADLCAAGVGAPHIRQRLWFVAESNGGHICAEREQRGGQQRFVEANGRVGNVEHAEIDGWKQRRSQPGERGIERGRGQNGVLGDSSFDGSRAFDGKSRQGARQKIKVGGSSFSGVVLDDAERTGSQGRSVGGNGSDQRASRAAGMDSGVEHTTFQQVGISRCSWQSRETEWLSCSDGKLRPTQSSLFPLAHGVPARVAKLRALGNAIVPQVAKEFILASLDFPPS